MFKILPDLSELLLSPVQERLKSCYVNSILINVLYRTMNLSLRGYRIWRRLLKEITRNLLGELIANVTPMT